MNYSKKTELLLQRMNRVALRQEYIFNKKKITKLITEVYTFLELPVPEIVWCKDITNDNFARAARAAGAAWAAWSAWSTWSTWSAWSAWSARAAGSARAARAAWATGIDYDFDCFVFEHEYLERNQGNESDYKALRAYELFLQLKEAGLGFFAQQDNILYCCPNPIIKLDNLRYHSEESPAIFWKDGIELYYLHGVNFKKELWEKILSKSMSFKDCMELKNIEQRMMALKYFDPETLLKEANATLTSKVRGYELYEIENLFPATQYFLKYTCPSTGRIYISGITPSIGSQKDAIAALKWKFYLEDDESEIFTAES